jgi:hypothetical protein
MSSEWIAIGAPRGGSVVLEVSDATGPAFYWSPSYVAAMLGQRFVTHWQLAEPIDLRACRTRWVDAKCETVAADALDGVTLVSASGARVTLAQATRLLGFESPESFIEIPSVSAAPAPPSIGVGIPSDGFYSSRKGASHLPGKSRRWMLANARKIPGARKVGRDWVVPHAVFAQWMADQDAARCRAEAVVPSANLDAHAIAERTLANAGLRPTREY